MYYTVVGMTTAILGGETWLYGMSLKYIEWTLNILNEKSEYIKLTMTNESLNIPNEKLCYRSSGVIFCFRWVIKTVQQVAVQNSQHWSSIPQ